MNGTRLMVVPPGIAAHLDRFDRSRERKRSANDADRLRKYLARFDLEWGALKARLHEASTR